MKESNELSFEKIRSYLSDSEYLIKQIKPFLDERYKLYDLLSNPFLKEHKHFIINEISLVNKNISKILGI